MSSLRDASSLHNHSSNTTKNKSFSLFHYLQRHPHVTNGIRYGALGFIVALPLHVYWIASMIDSSGNLIQEHRMNVSRLLAALHEQEEKSRLRRDYYMIYEKNRKNNNNNKNKNNRDGASPSSASSMYEIEKERNKELRNLIKEAETQMVTLNESGRRFKAFKVY